MSKLLRDKPLWFHILLALAFLFIIAFLFVISLNWITKHGESSSVPVVTGKTVSQAKAMLSGKSFELVIQDSVYYDSLPPGQILKQIPEADAVVKINRTVYVTVNRFIAPDVEVPNIKGYSYRNAEMVLRNAGLKIGDTTFRADFAKNTVLEMSYHSNPLSPGTKLKMGSVIDLVLSAGVSQEAMPVPELVGRTFEEAKALLDAQGILLASVVPNADVKDSSSAYVYRQIPSPRTLDGKRLSIRAGQTIDVFLQVERPVIDSTLIQPTAPKQEE